MYTTKTATVNWESQKVLSQIADQVNKPLSEITRLLQYIKNKPVKTDAETKRISSIILESSVQIERLIEDIRQLEQRKRIEVRIQDSFRYPELYQKTRNCLCKPDAEWLAGVEKIILGHLENSLLSAAWLAIQMGMDEKAFCQKIERCVGAAITIYIRDLRLHRAKELLENYVLSTVNEVASAVGLRDPHYFSNLYKSRFGKKPKDYLE
jgi:AraC-like DNA-binding protein